MTDLNSAVRRVAAEVIGVHPDQIAPTATLAGEFAHTDDPITALNFDSLDLVEFAMLLEDRFRIVISDDEALALTNIDDAVQLVARRQAPANA